jgi:single-strand DNA-binding protein
MSYSNINRVVLVGRLTSDPELRALPSGSNVCELRVACNTTRKTAEGDYAEKPNFFNVSVYGLAGESVHRYMGRGRRVAIDGRLDWHEWETTEGGKRQAVKIVAESVQFLDGRGEQAGSSGSSDDEGSLEGSLGDSIDGDSNADERELVGVGSGIEDDLVF